MPAIVTASVSPRSCGHRDVTVTFNGVPYVFPDLHDGALSEPLTTEETRAFLLYSARYLRSKGIPFASFLNRVLVGEEATNVKQYDFLGPGNVVTKTNIGTAYSNVLPGANGERVLVDFTGSIEMRIILSANFPAGSVGAFGARLVRDGDSLVLYENAAIAAAPSGERELDTGWVVLPAWAIASGEVLVRFQAKSVTSTDDPIFRRCAIFTR